MYTTHSTFMIDMDKPREVKIVYEDKNTKDTKISTDIWNADSDSLLPIQTSLLHTFAHILFTVIDFFFIMLKGSELTFSGMSSPSINKYLYVSIPVGIIYCIIFQ